MRTLHTNSLRTRALSTAGAAAIAVALAGVATPALAQQAEDCDGQLDANGVCIESDDRVTVTGSRIQRQDFTANSPIVTVDSDTFENTSTIGIETVLNQLPQFVPAITEFTSSTLQATATTTPGASIVNLRGLGSFRTLTLIDGRRAQPQNATLAVDTNSIPSSAIQRVEIISGGASAVYGADAVAGVVNFILKDDYEGMEFTTRYGITEEGDGEQFQTSALIGANFANGKGNVMLGAEHASRSAAYNRNRDWLREQLSDPFLTGTEGLVSETYVDFGRSSLAGRPKQAAIDTIFDMQPTDCVIPGRGTPCLSPDTNDKYFVNRTADGTGTLFTGAVASFGTNGATGLYRYEGPLQSSEYPDLPLRKIRADNILDENNLEALTTVPLTRYSMFGKAEFEFTDNVRAYLRGNFSSNETRTATVYSPAVNNWSASIPVGFEGTLWEDSLNTDGTTNADYRPGGAYGLNCPATGGCTESQAFPLPPELEFLLRNRDNPNEDVDVHRVMDYLPRRSTENRTSVYQLTFGLEGELPNDWLWDASATYGKAEQTTLNEDFASLAQYRAVIGSPNFGQNFFQTGLSPTSGGVGRCTSGLPIFRDIAVSQDCIDTITADMQATGALTQTIVEANLSGDLFDMPAGPLSFAIGADFRAYDYKYVNDNLNHVNTFLDQAIGLFAQGNTDGYLDTREVYGEMLVPIVRDLPFVQQLNLELGGRYSDYNTSGGVETYKVLGDWAVNDWLRLRGGYNHATRAPHIAEYFLGRTISFGVIYDPCSRNASATIADYSANPDDNPNAAQVEALCRSLMTSQAQEIYYENTPLAQMPTSVFTSVYRRGNPNLEPESADTFTFGGVLRSPIDNPWLSGLDLTVDYYSINIEDIIALQSGDDVWRRCVLSNDPGSEECGAVFRDPFDGRLTLADLSYSNEGEITFAGVDVQVNWRAEFADLGIDMVPGGMSVSSQVTIPTERTTKASASANENDYVGTLGCDLGVSCSGYKYQVFTTMNYFTGPWSASLRWNYYPTIKASDAAIDPDTLQRGVFEDYHVFSLTGSYRVGETLTLRAGVDNLFNVEPPLSGGSYAADGSLINPTDLPSPATPSGDARYDQLGRRFFAGASVTF